ncbi:MAG TPA: thioredoxin-disulfide reductase [Syntrophomonadaceae bacterium]|nr:thioredoxin-disulfide reductase [Syntrophomonadaceae bacterium]
MYDVIIIGSGPAGLSAAIYTGRAKLKTLILEAGLIGGNAAITDLIDNYPGFPFGISGPELIENFTKQAERFGAEIRLEEVISLVPIQEGHKVVTSSGNEYKARAIIIAVGAKRRELGVSGEEEFSGRGVSYCATCDGAFFNDATVAVVGGGDSAIKEALYLSEIASKVYLIHRREGFRANQTAIDKLRETHNIETKLNKVISQVKGKNIMDAVMVQDVISGAEEELGVEGLFVSIGLVPAAEFVGDYIPTEDGYIITNDSLETSVKGIFAAGDIRLKEGRQVATAVGDGALAGIVVTEYLKA